MKVFRSHLLVCGGTGCHASGSIAVRKALVDELNRKGLAEEIKVVETGCNGFCAQGPMMVVYPEGIIYMNIQTADVPVLVEEHFVKGRPVERLFYKEPGKEDRIPSMQEIPFFALQDLRVLRNRGLIDPENIEEYIARDGYSGMARALTEMTPEQIVQEVLKSGLRGRGGAGFPTGLKWELGRKSPGDIKYIICNADEGDPGAFMDRAVIEGNPHSVIEGMIIGAYALCSHLGYVYIRAEYPLAVERLHRAIAQAREKGFLGPKVFGTDFDFDIKVKLGAGAFVCGEETALIASIEGQRGMPRPKPPFPVNKGLWQRPTVINNVETLANIPYIIRKGCGWYASYGTEKSKGTKVFALTGKIRNPGLIEVPMGITLREIVEEIGGGTESGKPVKAVQTGGPSGGCIPASMLDLNVDYESLAKVGSIVGSGGMIVLDDDDCMVNVARYFVQFTQEESCGKCVPCRIGTKRLLEIMDRITRGQGREDDIERLETLSAGIKAMSLCGLGQTAPNPILSTLKYFREEYEAHILHKKCPSKVCKALLTYRILEDKCKACGACLRACPSGAITGEKKVPHKIDPAKCVRCGACFEVCKFKSVDRE